MVAEQNVDVPAPRGGLQGFHPDQGSAAFFPDPRGDAFQGFFFRTISCGKSAHSGWQVSAELGGHVSSSTLSAHQMAHAGVVAHLNSSSLADFWDDEAGSGWMLLCTDEDVFWD